MSNNNNRVLGRLGAHELTPEQTQQVSGGLPTLFSRIVTEAAPHQDLINDI